MGCQGAGLRCLGVRKASIVVGPKILHDIVYIIYLLFIFMQKISLTARFTSSISAHLLMSGGYIC